MKGFRTYLAALIVAVEPLVEMALRSDSFDMGMFYRQVLIAAVFVALRTVTTTPPGARQ